MGTEIDREVAETNSGDAATRLTESQWELLMQIYANATEDASGTDRNQGLQHLVEMVAGSRPFPDPNNV